MKLRYSIPGKLWWIHNFLDYKSYKTIHNSIIKKRNLLKSGAVSADNFWQDILTSNINGPDVTNIKNYLPFEKLKILVANNPFHRMEDVGSYFHTMIYSWKKGSGINWHNDVGHKYGATYYLNSRWNEQWGGEFMFKGDSGSGFLPFVGNSLIIVKAPFQHKVNPVTSPIIPRITVQMFVK